MPRPFLAGAPVAGPLTHSLKMAVLLVPSVNVAMLIWRMAMPSQEDAM